jgi:hypothetical protein
MSTLPAMRRRPRLDVMPIESTGGYVPELVMERGMPASPDAERSILGAILLDGRHILETIEGLNDEDFSLESHQRIYRRMLDLHTSGRAIDLVMLVEELARRKEVESIGGVAYIASLTEGLPRRVSIRDYVNIMADKSISRQLIRRCNEMAERAVDQRDHGADLIRELTEGMLDITARAKTLLHAAPLREVFAGGLQFLASTQKSVEWAIEGLIQKRGNGVIVGDPGASKSLLTLHMLIHMTAGQDWLGCTIPTPMRVALISREDEPGLTQHRLLTLMEGVTDSVKDALFATNIDERMYFSTRAQMETFTLQKETDVAEIIAGLKKHQVEFAVFDVFRRLWDGDENDNQEVAKVLSILTRIQSECQCSVALIHHLNKSDGTGNIFSRIRGASSIYGWREWAFALSVTNPEEPVEEHIRKINFETKAALPSNPIHYRIGGVTGATTMVRCAPPLQGKKKGRRET